MVEFMSRANASKSKRRLYEIRQMADEIIIT
jgi:hypothetical protein